MKPCAHQSEPHPNCNVCSLYATNDKARDFWDGKLKALEPGSGYLPPLAADGNCSSCGKPRPAAAPVQEPSFIQKVVNFSDEYRAWKDAGQPLTPPDELRGRRETCNLCPNRDPEVDSCRLCGCPLSQNGLLVRLLTDAPTKLEMATASCPDKPPRWAAVTILASPGKVSK